MGRNRLPVRLLAPSLLVVCGMRPPEEGVEVEATAGYGEATVVRIGGCGTPTRTIRYGLPAADVRASWRSPKDWTVAVDAGRAPTTSAKVLEGPPLPPEEQEGFESIRLAARAGHHWRYGGFEVGPALASVVFLPAFVPSAEVWAGVPRIAYGWVGLATELPIMPDLPVELGIGHADEALRAELAVTTGAARLRAAGPLRPGLWLGAEGGLSYSAFHGDEYPAWRLGLTVDVVPARLASPPER